MNIGWVGTSIFYPELGFEVLNLTSINPIDHKPLWYQDTNSITIKLTMKELLFLKILKTSQCNIPHKALNNS